MLTFNGTLAKQKERILAELEIDIETVAQGLEEFCFASPQGIRVSKPASAETKLLLCAVASHPRYSLLNSALSSQTRSCDPKDASARLQLACLAAPLHHVRIMPQRPHPGAGITSAVTPAAPPELSLLQVVSSSLSHNCDAL
eukprot:4323891-Amphidinium_carterae.1